jgi:beta-glucosidase/6-phospho-beta-glucosidase/beta-galactosidase
MNSSWLKIGPEALYWGPRNVAKVWNASDIYRADGFGTRFGLLYVEYTTQQRTPKLSASFYREVAARNRLV